MLLRLRYLKIGTYILVGLCYFGFLFRESLHAYEQNKERLTVDNELDTLDYAAPSKQQLKLKRQQMQRQRLLAARQQSSTRPSDASTMRNTSLLVSTLNPVYEYSEELHTQTENELQQRRERLAEVCERYKLHEKYPLNTWEFFISPGHNLVWCNVFKAASSTWMYYFNILAGYDLSYLQHTEVQPLELARRRFPRPALEEMLELLPSALSFLFVRDPFVRIVSAYRNKLEGNRNRFYKRLGTSIVRQYRRRILGGPWPRYGPTFEEFVRFLIAEHEAGKHFDEHWAPIYSFCTPCSVNFSIIGKVEKTFQRDTEFIIRQAGLETLLLDKLPNRKQHRISNRAKSGIKSEALMSRYFAQLDRSTLDQLLNIYRMDFELFDYDYRRYYEMVHPWSLEELNTAAAMAAATPTSNSQPGSTMAIAATAS